MKTGILTGVGNGIGLSICKNLLKKRYKVIGISKSSNSNIIDLKKKYKNFVFIKLDLSKKKLTETKIQNILTNHKNITFLINNAGIRYRKNSINSNFRTYQKVLDNNFFSAAILSNAYIKYLSYKNFTLKSSIVNITSIVGPRGFADLSNYASSKGALEYFSKSLAVEYAKKNIRVNCVAPGFIKSSYHENFKKNSTLYDWTVNRTPMNRWGEIDEIYPLVEFLLSKGSSYITGNTIYVDGGWTAQ